MILVSIIFFGGIGYLEGAQEALDLPPAVVPTVIDLAWSDWPEMAQTHHGKDFYAKRHL